LFKEYKNDRIYLVFLLGAAIFWGLAVTGAVRAYSPVPYWDMWDGYLDFFVKVNSGDWSVWWAQHNEHRIFLARLLFWVDLAWFDGAGWFLLMVNYVLLGLVCFVFLMVLKEDCPSRYRFFGPFLVIWLSSWSQENNLTWGFQSQFILAQLLPLYAFFMLHKTVVKGREGQWSFIAACCLGVLSLGSMANGVLVLPLMSVYAVAVRLNWKRVAILVVLSCLGVLVYFYKYQAPAAHGSLLISLKEHPTDLIRYVLLYIGGPFSHIIGGHIGTLVAQAAGATLIACSVYLTWYSIRNFAKSSLQLALLTFITYVGGTALGTAGGRLVFGLDQALSSRYATPALMAWAALFILIAPKAVRVVGPHRWRIWVPISVLCLAMLPMQLKAMQSQRAILFERNVAALALELGIKDQAQISQVFPSAEWALLLSKIPKSQNLSVFGISPIKDAFEIMGTKVDHLDKTHRLCVGSLDEVSTVSEDSDYLRIRGWAYDSDAQVKPLFGTLIGNNDRIVGIVLLGQPRADVAGAVDRKAEKSGFKGYVKVQFGTEQLRLLAGDRGCLFPVTIAVK
jgi:hypothetical protein